MEYNPYKREIILKGKVLNELDKFVIDFVNILEKFVGYVIVSGYVSILLGRSWASEDVDFLIQDMTFSKFEMMFKELASQRFECLNTNQIKEAYEMLDEHAIRFSRETPIPNIEFKKITSKIQEDAFNNKLSVKFNGKSLFISPLELQIAYKLSLMSKGSFEEISSDKDFEDAKHLYEVFNEKLNKEKLLEYIKLFKVENRFELLKK